MRILGIGTDIVRVYRIEKAIKKYKFKFLYKIFTKKEIFLTKKKKNNYLSFAKRFAAKEAFVKAIGTGITNEIKFNEIEISNDTLGKPLISLKGKTKSVIQKKLKLKSYKIFLSLSDDKPWAIAFVIITFN